MSAPTRSWNDIWDHRSAPGESTSVLRRLMIGAGLDSGFAPFAEDGWLAYVRRVTDAVGMSAGDSVYEVGCGAGAFLYDLAMRGMSVSGIDRSPALVALARAAIDGSDFVVGDASDLDVTEQSDVVLAASVFQYFPDLDYAVGVIERMAAKARRAVVLLDLPDLAFQAESLARRQRLAGGAEAYAERYTGLEHLHFDRAEIVATLNRLGLRDVHVETQQMAGHDDAGFRFNAWGFFHS